MFKLKIKEDEKVILKAQAPTIDKFENIVKDLKKKYKGGL